MGTPKSCIEAGEKCSCQVWMSRFYVSTWASWVLCGLWAASWKLCCPWAALWVCQSFCYFPDWFGQDLISSCRQDIINRYNAVTVAYIPVVVSLGVQPSYASVAFHGFQALFDQAPVIPLEPLRSHPLACKIYLVCILPIINELIYVDSILEAGPPGFPVCLLLHFDHSPRTFIAAYW